MDLPQGFYQGEGGEKTNCCWASLERVSERGD